MKEIILTQDKVALVDDWNYDWLNIYIWHAVKTNNTFYARCHKPNSSRLLYMHRLIMKPKSGFIVDHIDRNGLNCLESNMRNATYSQNRMNSVNTYSKSNYKGVYYTKEGYIYVKIQVNGKPFTFNYFENEILAAKKYDELALLYFKEFANLNFKAL